MYIYLTINRVYALLLLADFCYGIVPLLDLIFTFISTLTIWSVVKAAIAMCAVQQHGKKKQCTAKPGGMDTISSNNNIPNNNNKNTNTQKPCLTTALPYSFVFSFLSLIHVSQCVYLCLCLSTEPRKRMNIKIYTWI